MDLKISKEIAKESAKEITKLKKRIKDDKETYISLLWDMVKDLKRQNYLTKKIIFILSVFILLSQIGIIYININTNKKLNDLIESQYYIKYQNRNNLIKKEECNEN